MQKNRRAALNLASLALIVLAIALGLSELAVYGLIEDRFNADVSYAFIRDIELIFISLTVVLYLSLSPASFALKAAAHAFAVIQIVGLPINILLQLDIIQDYQATFFFLGFVLAILCLRNALAVMRFKTNALEVVGENGFWMIYQKPSSLTTWMLFALDSASGHYSATDGRWAWYFSRHTGELIKEPLEREWLAGKMAVHIKGEPRKLREKLDSIVGTKFTVFTNCSTTFRRL